MNTLFNVISGDITIGTVTGSGQNFAMETGNNIAGADITANGAISNIATLALDNVGGTATFSGDVDVNALDVDNTVANLALTGSGSTIATNFTPSNDGTLVLGDASGDTLTFNGGLTESTTGTVTLSGSIVSSDDTINFGPITLGADTTINSAGGSIVTGNITGTSGQDITISSINGSTNTAIINGTIGAGNNINTITALGTVGVAFMGNVTTNNAAGNTFSALGSEIVFNNIALDTNAASNDGNVLLIADTVTGTLAADAGAAIFQLTPLTENAVIEAANANSGAITENVFYDIDNFGVLASVAIIGSSSHTGNIFVGNDLAAIDFAQASNIQIQNSGSGEICLSSFVFLLFNPIST